MAVEAQGSRVVEVGIVSGADLDQAVNYVRRGWRVVLFDQRSKRPRHEGWPDRALVDETAVRAAFNGHTHNIGVLLGVGGLCDVDLDCAEALAVAGYFLPETGMMFGRASKRMSHRIYTSDLAGKGYPATLVFRDPDAVKDAGPILELRIGGMRAAQTVFPPSTHPSGELIAFESGFDKDPAKVDGAELTNACKRVAAAALIARAWPAEGGHHPAQVLGGFLARTGMDAPAVDLFASAVLAHVGGRNAKDHVRTARNAAEAYEQGRNAYGFLELTTWLGDRRAKKIVEWLNYAEVAGRHPTADPLKSGGQGATADGTGGDDQAESLIAELAALPPLRYARQRREAAKIIGITAAMLDKLVVAGRKAEDVGEAQPAHWDVHPWPDPVEGVALLNAMADVFSRYAVLPQHAPEALALWVAHAWALDWFQCSPFATLISPTKRCGKTRVLAILKWLSPRSELASSVSAAALFRFIQEERPTLLLDEADRTVAGKEELEGILNSSHKRVAATVVRCEGQDYRPRRFSTWCPKAVATIAKLADTLRDRSIIIEMRRKTPEESIEAWNDDDTEEFAKLRRKLLRWTDDNAETLKRSSPDTPAGLDDRAADNWRPLLAIADAAGGNWPAHARDAAVALSGGREDDDALPRLLADIRAIFAEMPQAEYIGAAVLAERLANLDGSPWQEWKRDRPITPAGVARLLKRARIHPNRNSGSSRYFKSAFEDAWMRYLPIEG